LKQAFNRGCLNFIHSNLELNIIKDIEQIKGEFGTIDLIERNNIKVNEFKYGEISAKVGQASLDYIFKGIDLAVEGLVDTVVTGHIHKEAIKAAGSSYADRTEIFASYTKAKAKNYAMMLADKNLRVIHVSTHVPYAKHVI